MDHLAEPTVHKAPNFKSNEAPEPKPVQNPNDFSSGVNDQFNDLLQPKVEEPAAPEFDAEAEDEKGNPEETAAALIDMLDVAQKSFFVLMGSRKLKSKFPKKVMEKMMELDLKETVGEELTAGEKKQLAKYKAMFKRLDALAKDTPFTDSERADLERCTEAFVKKSGMNIPPHYWFMIQVGNVLSGRIINHVNL